MRYLCAHCEFPFESSAQPPRCTKCLRISGVEAQVTDSGSSDAKSFSPLWLIVGLVSVLIELAAFLYGWLEPPQGGAGVAAMVSWAVWAAMSALAIVAGLRGVLATMK